MKGVTTGVYHPDFSTFQSHVLKLSRRLSTAVKEERGKNPDIASGVRQNLYFKEDYENFGDEIIRAFVREFGMPQYWGDGVDLSWGWCDSDIRRSFK
jgi:hypothetical protein